MTTCIEIGHAKQRTGRRFGKDTRTRKYDSRKYRWNWIDLDNTGGLVTHQRRTQGVTSANENNRDDNDEETATGIQNRNWCGVDLWIASNAVKLIHCL